MSIQEHVHYPIEYIPPASILETEQSDHLSDTDSVFSSSSAIVGTPPSQSFPISDNEEQYTLDEFKVDVRTWIELDDSIKALQNAIKERRHAKKHLTDRITCFMNSNEIEDLITKNGRIRYKTNYVKAPLSHSDIQERICTFFDSESEAKELLSAIFGTRGRSEKTSLRRMKISG